VTSPGPPAPRDTHSFEIARRGYHPEQVDGHLRDLGARLSAADRARDAAERRVRAIEEELRALRSNSELPRSADSFGLRAEKILRMAEHEAADVRSRAAQEATAVVEQARAEAEKHRHGVEQTLIARSADLDQEATRRTVAVAEREQQAQALLAGAGEEAARIGEHARAGAEKVVAEAESATEQQRRRTDDECRRRCETAEQQLGRLSSLHDRVRTDIARLHTLLGAELDEPAGAGRTS
jgi:cell division septum initiation protein DivIVA